MIVSSKFKIKYDGTAWYQRYNQLKNVKTKKDKERFLTNHIPVLLN